ncbi:PEP-CTERM sorting domain-containing protein [Rugamonas sp. CCM 8940]|nr:PEP-CTERM sorting domain-containing protein [Rugamonas sp. CCM 8940]
MKNPTMKKIALSAMSLAAVLCAGSVQAAPVSATSSVAVGNFHYTLIDLDTNDNIAPSIHFAFPDTSNPWMRQGSSVDVNSTVRVEGEKDVIDSVNVRNVRVVDLSRASSTMGLVNTSSTITAGAGEFGIQGATSTVRGTAEIPVDSAFRGISSFVSRGSIFNVGDFTLSAHTKLVFSFDFAASASVFANANQVAASGVEFSAGLTYVDALGQRQYASVERHIRLDSHWDSAQSINETLSYSMSNTTANDLAGRGSMYSEASGYAFAAPVPEPETYAMLLAGLGLLGCMAKRRRA